jgi:thioesterase domain-containing protein
MSDQVQMHAESTASSGAGHEGSVEQYQFPCSPAQRTCWFLDRMSPGSASFNIAVRFLLRGAVQVPLLEEALRQVIQRHEVLRTRFTEINGEPRQLVESVVPFSLPLVDLRGLPSMEYEANAEELAAEEANTGFDVVSGPLFRGLLIRTANEQFMLLLTMHHIISDGWSVGIITDEMGRIYQALAANEPVQLSPMPIQYGDYSCWQQEWMETGELDRHLEVLRCRLDGFTPLAIPTDCDRPVSGSGLGKISSILLNQQLTESLKRFSERQGCTMFVTMLSSFLILLYLQSKQTDLTVRTQTAGRDRLELEGLVGWFVNSIVLRANLSEDASFSELVDTVRGVVLDSLEFQHVPFERLMELIRPKQAPSRHPPFQVNFIFQRDFVRPWRRAGVTMTPVPSKATGTFVDLNFFLVEREDGWRASVDTNTSVFHPETGMYFLECYQQILTSVAANPAQRVSDVAIPPRQMLRKPHFPSETFTLDNYVPPRNKQEEAVVEVWTKVLGVSGIGAYSNFFDLGGHSLKAVRLLSEFQRRFGFEIKVPELFIDPTPAAMAQVISGEANYSDPRALIPIQARGTRPPFFMIGGDYYFRPLAKHVGEDWPFVGVPLLKYRHLDVGKERLTIARELADLLIQEYGGGTPFLLGGWCADGLTAYEIARALIEKGQSIGLAVLFDAVNPEYYREVSTLIHSAGKTMTSLRSVFRVSGVGELLKNLPTMIRSLFRLLKRLGQRVADTLFADYSSLPAQFPVLVIRPPLSPLEQNDLGWSRACRERLTVVEVPGDHSSIFREPNVSVLGWKLRQQLENAMAQMEKQS